MTLRRLGVAAALACGVLAGGSEQRSPGGTDRESGWFSQASSLLNSMTEAGLDSGRRLADKVRTDVLPTARTVAGKVTEAAVAAGHKVAEHAEHLRPAATEVAASISETAVKVTQQVAEEAKNMMTGFFEDSEAKENESWSHGAVQVVDDQALIEAKVRDLIEINQISREKLASIGKRAFQAGGLGCATGGIFGFLFMGPGGLALGCKFTSIITATVTVADQIGKHWSEQLRRARSVWRLYQWSFEALGAKPWDDLGTAQKKYRACAKEHHPDKLGPDLDKDEKEWHVRKLGECQFANAFIKLFQRRWGAGLQAHKRQHTLDFLKSYAGVWASTFGSEGGVTEAELEEVMASLQGGHSEL